MRNVMKKNLLKVLLMASVLSVSPVVTAESNVVYAAENEYILPDSDSRAYTYDELSSLSNDELRLAINEYMQGMVEFLMQRICRIISIQKVGITEL